MSKVVDRRVVEMSFDNSNFEKNVQTSVKTVDSLKKALNMDGVSKGLESVDKAANNINLSRVADAAEALQRRFSVLGEIGHNALMKITNAVGSLATKMTSFVKDGIVGGGIKRAMNLEQANFMLQGLLKDEQAVADVMKNVSASVDGTAYSLDAAAKAAAMFAATGMRGGEQMEGALRAVAGVAAMTNAQYEDIAQIFTTVAGQGKVMADQYNQLASRGMNAAATIAQYLTKVGDGAVVTEAQVREMTSEGQISFELFAAAMDDAFGEHALKANETFTGAMSNIRSALARIGADFIAPLVKQNGELVTLFNTVRVMINEIRKLTTPYAVAAANWVNQMAVGFTGILEQITSVISGTYEVNDTTKTFLNIIQSVQNIMAGFQSIIAPIKMAWKDVFPEGLPNLLLLLTERIAGLTEHARLNAGQMSTLRSVFQIIFTVAKNLAIVIDGALTTAFALLGKAVNALGPIFDRFAGFITKNISATISWADQLGIVEKVIKTVTSFATSSGREIKAWFNNFKNLPQVQIAVEYLQKLFYALRDSAKEAFGKFGDVFDPFVKKLIDLKNLKFSDIINLFKDLKQIIIDTFGPSITKWFNDFKTNFGSVKDFVVDAFGKIGEAAIKGKDVLVSAIDWIVAKLTDIPLGSFVAVGFGGALLFLANKVVDIVSFIKDPLASLNSIFKGVGTVLTNFAKIESAFAAKINAESMFTIAKAIAVLAASLIALAQVPWEMLQTALATLGALAGGLIALGVAFAFINKIGGSGTQGVGVQLVALAGSMYIIARVLKDLNSLKMENMTETLAIFTAVLGELAIASAALSKFDASWESAVMVVAIAAAMKLMVSSINSIADMDPGRAISTVTVLIGLLGSMALLMAACGGVNWGAGVALLGASLSVKMMVGVVKDVNKMSISDIARGVLVIAAFEALLIALAVAVRLAGKNGTQAAGAFTAFAGSVAIMAGAIKIISLISDAELERGIATMAKMELLFAGVALITRLAGKNGGAAAKAMLSFSASMIIISAAIGIISMIPPERVEAAVEAIQKVGAIMAIIVGMTKWAADAKGTMIAIAAALGIISVALAGLTFVDQDALESTSKALSRVMGMMAVVVAATGISDKATSQLLIITGAIGLIAGILAMMSAFEVKSSIENATAIGILLTAMSASMLLLSHAEKISSSAMVGLLALSGVVVILGAVLAGLSALEVETSMTNVLALVTLLGAISLVVLMFDKGQLSSAAMAHAVQGAAAIGLFVATLSGFIAAIGALMLNIEGLEASFDKGLEILGKLGTGLGEFIGNFVGGILQGISNALPGIGNNLIIFGGQLAVFGGQLNMFPDGATDKLAQIIALMTMLAGAELVSAVTSGLSWLMGGFSMDDMVANFEKFIQGVIRINAALRNVNFNDDAINSVKKMGELFIALQEAMPREGGLLQDLIGNTKDIGAFGQSCFNFIQAMKNANDQLDGVTFNDEAIESAAKAGELFVALQNALPREGGALQEFLGEKLDLGQFGQRIKSFLTGLTAASDILEANPIDASAIESAANAGQMMSDLQNSLPEYGGILQEWFGGTMTLDSFGQSIYIFFSKLSQASKYLVANPIDEGAVTSAKNAGRMMSDLANRLPGTQGKIAEWFGSDTMDLAVFGEKIQQFGTSLNIFAAHVGNVKSAVMTEVVESVKTLCTMFDYLPEDESWFDGTMSIANFGEKLKDFAEKFKAACDMLASTDTDSMNTMARSITSLMMVFKDAKGLDLSELEGFGTLIKDLATEALTNFASVFEEYDVVSVTSGFIQRFVDSFTIDPEALVAPFNTLMEQALHTLSAGEAKFRDAAVLLMSSFGVGIQTGTIIASTAGINLAQNIISLFVAHVNSNGPEAGMSLVQAIIQGISAQTNTAVFFIEMLGALMLAALRKRAPEFQEAGRTLIESMTTGISSMQAKTQLTVELLLNGLLITIASNMSKFVEAGQTLASKVSEGIVVGTPAVITQINNLVGAMTDTLYASAGRMEAAGAYLAQGLANGVSNNAWRVRQVAANLADSIAGTINRALQIHSPSKVGEKTGENYDQGLANGLINGATVVSNAAGVVASSVTNPINNTLDGLSAGITAVGEAANAATNPTNQLLGGIASGLGAVGNAASAATTEVDKSNETLLEISYELGKQILKKLEEGMKSESLGVITDAVIEALQAGVPDIISRVENLGSDIANKIREGITDTEGFGQSITNQLTNFTPDIEAHFVHIGQTIVNYIQSGMMLGEEKLPEALNDILAKIMPGILENIGKLGSDSIALKVLEGMSNNSKELADGMKEMLTGFFPELDEPMYNCGKQMLSKIKEGLEADGSDVIRDTLISILTQSIPAVLEKFSELSTGAAEEVKKAASAFENFGTMLESYVDKSRESLLGKMYQYGIDLITYIYNGMSSYEKLFSSGMSRIVTSGFSFTLEFFTKFGTDTVSAIIDGMEKSEKSPSEVLKESLEEVVPTLLASFKAMGVRLMEGMMITPAEMIKTSMMSIFPDLVEQFLIYGEEFVKSLANGIFVRRDDPVKQLSSVIALMVQKGRNSYNLFYEIGKLYDEGIAKGLRDYAYLVISAARELAEAMQAAMMVTLDMHSPSKVGEEDGLNWSLGISNGITKGIANVVSTSKTLASQIRGTFDSVMTSVIESINTDSEYRPVIHPVLDLDSVKSDLGQLDTTIANSRAIELNAKMNASSENSENQNGSEKEQSVYNFTQNNYSPKALSRLDIYRQTKNLVSVGKRRVSKR